MNNNQDMFDERYRKVLQRHRQLSRGYVTKLGTNGVINHYPIGQFRNPVTLKGLALPIAILVFLKACMITVLGEAAYNEQVALLSEGSFGEQIGAFFMQIDPLSWPVAQLLTSIIG